MRIKVEGVAPDMIANNLTPNVPIHPGEMIKDKIEFRGISQKALAAEIGIPASVLNEVLNGKRAVTTEFALLLEAALGIEADLWLKLQSDYNKQIVKSDSNFMARIEKNPPSRRFWNISARRCLLLLKLFIILAFIYYS